MHLKSIGLALFLVGNLPFFFVLLCILGQFSKYKPPGGLYLEGRFNGGFFALQVLGGLYLEGLIHGGAYFQNFMVSLPL